MTTKKRTKTPTKTKATQKKPKRNDSLAEFYQALTKLDTNHRELLHVARDSEEATRKDLGKRFNPDAHNQCAPYAMWGMNGATYQLLERLLEVPHRDRHDCIVEWLDLLETLPEFWERQKPARKAS
jgi:hypothetical protein